MAYQAFRKALERLQEPATKKNETTSRSVWAADSTSLLQDRSVGRQCEGIIISFMERRSGGFRLPIPTDELTRLIEEEADDLDLDAQLPDGVEGLTDFFADRRPKVRIAEELSTERVAIIGCERLSRTSLATLISTHHCGDAMVLQPMDILWNRRGHALGRRSWMRLKMIGWNGRPVTFAARCSCRPALYASGFRSLRYDRTPSRHSRRSRRRVPSLFRSLQNEATSPISRRESGS